MVSSSPALGMRAAASGSFSFSVMSAFLASMSSTLPAKFQRIACSLDDRGHQLHRLALDRGPNLIAASLLPLVRMNCHSAKESCSGVPFLSMSAAWSAGDGAGATVNPAGMVASVLAVGQQRIKAVLGAVIAGILILGVRQQLRRGRGGLGNPEQAIHHRRLRRKIGQRQQVDAVYVGWLQRPQLPSGPAAPWRSPLPAERRAPPSRGRSRGTKFFMVFHWSSV